VTPPVSPPSLPIDAHLGAIAAALGRHPALVVQATPGAGKTTRVPPALLPVTSGQIVVLEPRRLAARLSAERVAAELGEEPGRTVGYQIRFDTRASAATRLVFVTEGVFTRRALDDPKLGGIGCVVIDEFHERHIHTDLAVAIVRKLQKTTRPDLKLVVMSATLDARQLGAYLPDAATFVVEGRAYPVAVEYLPAGPEATTEQAVRGAVLRMLQDERCPQDILVFLTGMQEIRRCADALRGVAGDGVDVLPLTADVPPREQARVFASSGRRKVILATNVAETSLTIPGVTGVVDAGRAKIAGHAAWSGMPTLDVKRVSQAACIQRAGRAGRVRPGVAYRLFSENDFLSRPPFSAPDVKRLDFAETLVTLLALKRAWGESWTAVADALPWFEAPDAAAVAAAQALLGQLGVVSASLELTPRGVEAARLPLHPRLGAIVAKGRQSGLASPALMAACLIAEGMVLGRGGPAADRSDSDVAYQMEVVADVVQGRRLSSRALEAAVDRGAAQRVAQLQATLARRIGVDPGFDPRAVDPQALAACLIAGFPDRVGRRRQVAAQHQRPGDRPLYNLCLGGGAVLGDASVVEGRDLILALDASESQTRSKDRGVVIHVASEITLDTLLESPADLLSERVETVWSDDAQRVDVWARTYYGQVVVAETRGTTRDVHQAEVEELLRAKLAERWPKPFDDDSDLRSYHERVRLLAGAGMPWAEDLPRFEGEMLELLLAAVCEGKRSFKEIAERPLAEYIHDQLPYELGRELRAALPSELGLPNGRRLKIRYEAGKPPYVEGFIQDFYGLTATPALLGGRLPLIMHLWAPNRRPIQVTSDLTGFWTNHYPSLRQDLGRNYPKHHWPDDPRTAPPVLHKASLK
jgi:ATP-dependent helicase HrpB